MPHAPLTKDEEWKYAKEALTWYGWGSPIGLGSTSSMIVR